MKLNKTTWYQADSVELKVIDFCCVVFAFLICEQNKQWLIAGIYNVSSNQTAYIRAHFTEENFWLIS